MSCIYRYKLVLAKAIPIEINFMQICSLMSFISRVYPRVEFFMAHAEAGRQSQPPPTALYAPKNYHNNTERKSSDALFHHGKRQHCLPYIFDLSSCYIFVTVAAALS